MPVSAETAFANLEQLEEELEDLVFPPADKLPSKYKWLAGRKIFPPEMGAFFIKQKQGRPRLIKVAILRIILGRSYANKVISNDTPARRAYLAARNEGVFENKNVAKRVKERGTINGSLTDPDDRKLLRIIVEAAEEDGYLSFRSLKRHLKISCDHDDALTDKEERAQLLLGLIALWIGYGMTARYAILRQVWGAETTEDLATDTYGTKLKYYMDPTSAHDISGILKTAGKELGFSNRYFAKVIKVVNGKLFSLKNKKQIHEDAIELLNIAYVLLCKARNAPKSVLDVGDKVKKAIQLRDGTAAKQRAESGHLIKYTAAEHAAVITYFTELYRNHGLKEHWSYKDAAVAMNWVGNFERTPKQGMNYVQSHTVSIAMELMELDVNPTVFATKSRLASGGIFTDSSSPSGFSYDLDRLMRDRPDLERKLEQYKHKKNKSSSASTKQPAQQIDFRSLDQSVAEAAKEEDDKEEDELAQLDDEFEKAFVF